MPIKGKIIIVSYTFPLASGIGGRRWVKFAKELNKRKVDLKIFSALLPRSKESEWKKDLIGLENQIKYLDTGLVRHLANVPDTFSEKIIYKLVLFFIKIYAKGNY